MAANRTFRVFISSTFEDFQQERELLRSRVWPELEDFCKRHGASFEAVDLRWGIPSNSAEDLDIVSICLDEVDRCRKLSPRPNFIALIGNRYGWRPLPVTIPEPVVKLLPVKARAIVEEYYLPDENAIPPVYLANRNRLTGPEKENEVIRRIREMLISHPSHPDLENHFFKSATHLEIDAGIFSPAMEGHEDHFYACFREIAEFSEGIPSGAIRDTSRKYLDVTTADGCLLPDADAGSWLNKLKQEIRQKLHLHPGQIGTYPTSLQELSDLPLPPYCETLCNDLGEWIKGMIEKELAILDSIDPLSFEKAQHKRFRDLRNETFGGREALLREILEACSHKRERNVICIHGEGGSGKSALLSRLIALTEETHPGADLLYRFIGATPASVSLNSLLDSLVDEMEVPGPFAGKGSRTSREEQVSAFQASLNSPHRKTTFLFLDALDQLLNTENAHSLYWFPQEIHPEITLVCSVLNGNVLDAFRTIYPDAVFFDLSPQHQALSDNECREMLQALLSRKPRRWVQEEQLRHILSVFRNNPLLLNLKLMAENARHWHSFDRPEELEARHLGVREQVSDQIALLFRRLSAGDKHGMAFVQDVLAFIALSREGASDKEIQEMLWMDDAYRREFDARKHQNQPEVGSLPPVIWSRLFFELEPFLMERSSGGILVLDFFHRIFREVVRAGLEEAEVWRLHNLMADYFGNDLRQPVRHHTAGRIVYNTRKLTELPFHLSAAGRITELELTLTDYLFLDAKIRSGKIYELMEDFQQAIGADTGGVLKRLPLIAKAFRNDINFIARHPSSFFQCLFNSCWWHDHPEKQRCYQEPLPPRDPDHPLLYPLMESWEKTRSAVEPGFYWLRALQPPSVELDGPQSGILRGLSSPVIFVTWSADSKEILAVCNRGEFIRWDAESRNINQFFPLSCDRSFMFKPNSKQRFTKETEIITDLGGVLADHPGFEYWAWSGLVSANGRLMLSGSVAGDVALWEFSEKGQTEFSLQPEGFPEMEKETRRPVRGLSFSGNLAYGASGHADGSVVVWDLKQKCSCAFLQHQEGWVNSIAMNQDASLMVSGGGDGVLYLWKRDPDTGTYTETRLTGHTDRIWIVALSADDRLAATGSDDKTVRIWDLETTKELKCLKGHTRWVQALAFDSSARKLASSGGDGKILLWDVPGKSLQPAGELTGHDDSILSLSFSGDDRFLLSGSRDQSVRIWDLHVRISGSNLTGHSDRISCASFSADGHYLVTGSGDQTIRLWDTGCGKPLGDALPVDQIVTSVKMLPNNRAILVGTANGEVVYAGMDPLLIEKRLALFSDRIYAVAVSVDSRLAIAGSQSGRVILWNIRTAEILCNHLFEHTSILSLALSHDSACVAVGTRSGGIILLKIIRDKGHRYMLEEISRKQVFTAWVDDLIFSSDDQYLEARGGSWNDRNIKVVEAETLTNVYPERAFKDGAVGAFGAYRMEFLVGETAVWDREGKSTIAWYPRSLEFAAMHPARRQWAGIQRYNLHHFRLEGGE